MPRNFKYGDKVYITSGIHEGRIGEVRGYNGGVIFITPRQYLLYVSYECEHYKKTWDISWVNASYLMEVSNHSVGDVRMVHRREKRRRRVFPDIYLSFGGFHMSIEFRREADSEESW